MSSGTPGRDRAPVFFRFPAAGVTTTASARAAAAAGDAWHASAGVGDPAGWRVKAQWTTRGEI